MKIPIRDAKIVADANGCTQVIIAAWDGKNTHIVTYGKTTEDCAQAALGGNKIKAALGWPKDLNAEPKRVQKLLDRIAELEEQVATGGLPKLRMPNVSPEASAGTVMIYSITEYERGWGARPDGYIAFLTQKDADDFVSKKYDGRQDGAAPDYYVNYDKVGERLATAKFIQGFKGNRHFAFDKMSEILK